MSEKECEKSSDGKHKYQMLKSGFNPIYACVYCFKNRPKTIFCPHCSHLIEIEEENIFGE